MTTLRLPWLEMSILIPLVGAIGIGLARNPDLARRKAVVIAAATLMCAIGAWLEFNQLRTYEVQDRFDAITRLLGEDALVIDELSAPLLPLGALLFLTTYIATPRTKCKRVSFAGSLVSLALLLATLGCKAPYGLIALLCAGTVPPYLELRARHKPTRVYSLHMGLFVVLLTSGGLLANSFDHASPQFLVGMALLTAAVLVRSGIFPLHVWMADLFEHATFGTALLFVTPMLGAYAAVRLIVPVAPEWLLRSIALLALFTAVYAAGMALVQREARRFFGCILLSHSSLVLVGLDMATPIGLTGALSLWLSIGLALSGFGLTLRSIEARIGRVSLASCHGLYDHMPRLAAFFLLTGLASVGFPGTFGFIGTELLVEGAIAMNPLVGTAVVLTAALNGITVLQTYFRVFAGGRHAASVSLHSRRSEKFAVLTVSALILAGGFYPQPGVASRHHAAVELLNQRRAFTEGDAARPTGVKIAATYGDKNAKLRSTHEKK